MRILTHEKEKKKVGEEIGGWILKQFYLLLIWKPRNLSI